MSSFFLRLSILLFIVAVLPGCASKAPPGERKSPQQGLIYGNISVVDDEINEIELRQYGKIYIPPFIIPPKVLVYRNGNFLAANLPPGNYYIARLSSRKTDYTLVNNSQTAYQWIIRVRPGGTQFVGAYRITNIEPGIFGKGHFDFRSVLHPTERRVLKHMFDVTSGTGWQDLIARRIRELN